MQGACQVANKALVKSQVGVQQDISLRNKNSQAVMGFATSVKDSDELGGPSHRDASYCSGVGYTHQNV
jgi:hypothetical protein